MVHKGGQKYPKTVHMVYEWPLTDFAYVEHVKTNDNFQKTNYGIFRQSECKLMYFGVPRHVWVESDKLC